MRTFTLDSNVVSHLLRHDSVVSKRLQQENDKENDYHTSARLL